jgi:hypothetical protein
VTQPIVAWLAKEASGQLPANLVRDDVLDCQVSFPKADDAAVIWPEDLDGCASLFRFTPVFAALGKIVLAARTFMDFSMSAARRSRHQRRRLSAVGFWLG